jgi:hypothetical protein
VKARPCSTGPLFVRPLRQYFTCADYRKYDGSRPHKPSRKGLNLNMQKEQITTCWRKCKLRSRNTNSDIRLKAVKPENFRRIQNRGRSLAKVDNLWSKHTRNDAREANKWTVQTNTQATVRVSGVLQRLGIQQEASMWSRDELLGVTTGNFLTNRSRNEIHYLAQVFIYLLV